VIKCEECYLTACEANKITLQRSFSEAVKKYQKPGDSPETTKCYGPRNRSEDPQPDLNDDHE